MIKWERINGAYCFGKEWKKDSDEGQVGKWPIFRRAKVPGGWLVTMSMSKTDFGFVISDSDPACKMEIIRNYGERGEMAAVGAGYGWGYGYGGMVFVPDPGHLWDGNSLE